MAHVRSSRGGVNNTGAHSEPVAGGAGGGVGLGQVHVGAGDNFRSDQIVSTDGLRELVGVGQHDQRAGHDAFDILHLVLERRLKRGLTTVVDSLGLDDAMRADWIEMARRRDRPVQVVAFDVAARECRARQQAARSTRPIEGADEPAETNGGGAARIGG